MYKNEKCMTASVATFVFREIIEKECCDCDGSGGHSPLMTENKDKNKSWYSVYILVQPSYK